MLRAMHGTVSFYGGPILNSQPCRAIWLAEWHSACTDMPSSGSIARATFFQRSFAHACCELMKASCIFFPPPRSPVQFYAPWCGFCKQLKDTWISLAKSSLVKGKAKIGAVDCTKHQSVCQQLGVSGYPTIMRVGLYYKSDWCTIQMHNLLLE